MAEPIKLAVTTCIAWTCPHYGTILGMQLDPIEVASKVAEAAVNKTISTLLPQIHVNDLQPDSPIAQRSFT